MKKVAQVVIIGFVLVGVFSDFLANSRPLYCETSDGTIEYPQFLDLVQRVGLRTDTSSFSSPAACVKVIWAPIPFDANGSAVLADRFLPPGTWTDHPKGRAKHWLGTDRLGRDVAAILVYGCKVSLYIACLAMSIAMFLGLCLGGSAGFFGNRLKVGTLALTVVGLVGSYLIFLAFHSSLAWILILAILPLVFLFPATHRITISLDALVVRSIEIFSAIPLLLLLLAISSLVLRPGFTGIAVLVGVLSWPRYARYMRAEVLKIKEQEYITAAKLSGETNLQILRHYILPEALPVLLVVFTYGIAATILLESTLSFLGIGLPVDQITWGTLLAQSRQSLQSWWLALFPGLAIFVLILALNYLAEARQQNIRRF